jgi:hypothetical protein
MTYNRKSFVTFVLLHDIAGSRFSCITYYNVARCALRLFQLLVFRRSPTL